MIFNARIRLDLSGLDRPLIHIISFQHTPAIALLVDVRRPIVVFLFIDIFAGPVLLFRELGFVFCCEVASIPGSHAIFSLLDMLCMVFGFVTVTSQKRDGKIHISLKI